MTALRRSLEPRVRAWWAGEAGAAGTLLSTLLLPLEGLYRSLLLAQRLGYAGGLLRAARAPLPVISLGNLTVGGTGKTPVTAFVARRLAALGERPAVLLRGYGADEAALHRRWNPGVPVWVDPDRVRGARRAAAEGATVAVLDDGMQHRRLARDLDLALVSAEQPLRARVLPRGPFREPRGALARAGFVLVTRRTADDDRTRAALAWVRRTAPAAPLGVARLVPAGWRALDGATTDAPRGPLLAVTSIAEPASFARMVATLTGERPQEMTFPDHHAYGADDARRIRKAAGGGTVVTTEKDAVKLDALEGTLPPVRVLALDVEIEEGADALDRALHEAITRRRGGVC